MVADFIQSEFWLELCREIINKDAQYLIDTGFRMLAPGDTEPAVVAKPYASLVTKTYRKNALDNANWPDPPDEGWITPENWFARIKDVVRTLVVVKYLDGVEVVAALVTDVAERLSLPCAVSFEARDEGYYAVHINVSLPLALPGPRWELENVVVAVEVQVATQVQEVIRSLTHSFYERRRRVAKDVDRQWQWDYRSDEFVPNYLGHILHYVEGMIMEIRDRQGKDPQ